MSTCHKVLLADPDAQLLNEYSRELRRAGFDVHTATDAITCIEELKDFDPDFLVLEPMIPWGRGDGILSFMREEADVPLVPVIVLTAGTDLLEGYQLPQFPILERHQKPLAAEKIVASVKKLADATSPS